MRVLIVYAHPEKKSFNGAMKRTAVDVFHEKGDRVVVSDLYEMGWNPVAGSEDFLSRGNPGFLKYSYEQAHASRCDTYADDIFEEQEKIRACDLLILQFPMWWYGFPAILKGWVDRVIAKGAMYEDGRIYDRGMFQKKKFLISMTTGGVPNPTVDREDVERIVHYLSHGIFYFLGFTVLKPYIVCSPAAMEYAGRHEALKRYEEFIENIEQAPVMPYNQTIPQEHTHMLGCSGWMEKGMGE